jgi:hypothetical protein
MYNAAVSMNNSLTTAFAVAGIDINLAEDDNVSIKKILKYLDASSKYSYHGFAVVSVDQQFANIKNVSIYTVKNKTRILTTWFPGR